MAKQVILASAIDAFAVRPNERGGGRRPKCRFKGCRKGQVAVMKYTPTHDANAQEGVGVCLDHLVHEANRVLSHHKFHREV